jgi:hypothetical protein
MRNPLISRLLSEDDVVPVIANVPRATFRNRMVKKRQIEDEGDDSVARLVGEAKDEKESIIPDDAERMDTTEIVVGKPLKQPKEVVQEPSHPSGDKEKYLTPYSALTAPDVTPQSTQPIDPSQVPGVTGPEKFTASDLERAQPIEGGEGHVAAKAMDVLLGRNRGKPAPEEGEGEIEQFQKAGATVTEEQAAAMMGVSPVPQAAAAKAANLMVAAADGGNAMPEPAPISDGSKIYSAFRRVMG